MQIDTELPGTRAQRDDRINIISEALIAEGFQIDVDFEAIYGRGWEIVAIRTTSTEAQRTIEAMVADYETADAEEAELGSRLRSQDPSHTDEQEEDHELYGPDAMI